MNVTLIRLKILVVRSNRSILMILCLAIVSRQSVISARDQERSFVLFPAYVSIIWGAHGLLEAILAGEKAGPTH